MISTKGRYALSVMLDLAQQHSDQYIPLDEIATRQGISKKYLEIIIKTLVQQNLVLGLRGKGGGYKLTRTAAEYSVGEILEASENSLAIVSCLQADQPCHNAEHCPTLPMWMRFDKMIHDFFYGISLQDLIDENTAKISLSKNTAEQ